MKKLIRHFFALLPVFALGISAMMYLFFGIAQFQYKRAAHENIAANKNLQTIKIPLKDFNKLANNDEIWYGGELYDISSYIIDNDMVSVVIFHDVQEESLVKTIADNYELSDKYVPDNGVHIVKHRIHIPDDSKILVAIQMPVNFTAPGSYHPLPYFVQYASPAHTSIIKPPPQIG